MADVTTSRRRLSVWLIAGLCVVAVSCQNAPEAREPSASASQARTPLKPSLAKAKLTEATAAAKKWKADAVLIQVAGNGIGDDGMEVLWDYGFYSPAAKTCLVVNVANTTTQQESGGEMCESPELTDFMDSDQAIAIARKNGVTAPKVTMVVSASALRKGGVTWTVMDAAGMKSGNIMLDIDAKTGAILSKTKQG
jgi:hypothetical protein